MQQMPSEGASGNTGSASLAKQRDWPTLILLAGCLMLWGFALSGPAGSLTLSFVLLVFVLVLHSSLTHEMLHGIPFASARTETLAGAFQPGLAIPYLRFKRLHLAHHKDSRLTDPYDDPESNYLDPSVWKGLPRWGQILLALNNTLLGRMLIGPVIGQFMFMRSDARAIAKGNRKVLNDWLAHLPGVALTLWLVSVSPVPIWLYLLACYAALAILKIRTFLEHRAHDHACARTVVVEDRGVLAFLFLNNNFHVVHHMHPTVSWYRLPALYRSQKARFLERNEAYVYRSYGQIFRQFLWRPKDPVAHPLWQAPRE